MVVLLLEQLPGGGVGREQVSLLLQFHIRVVLAFNGSSDRGLGQRWREIPLQSFAHLVHLLRVGGNIHGIGHVEVTLLDFDRQLLRLPQDLEVAVLLIGQVLGMELLLGLHRLVELLHGPLLVGLRVQLDLVVLRLVLEVELGLLLVSLYTLFRQGVVLPELDHFRVLGVLSGWPLVSEGASCRALAVLGPDVELVEQRIVVQPRHRPPGLPAIRKLPFLRVIQGLQAFRLDDLLGVLVLLFHGELVRVNDRSSEGRGCGRLGLFSRELDVLLLAILLNGVELPVAGLRDVVPRLRPLVLQDRLSGGVIREAPGRLVVLVLAGVGRLGRHRSHAASGDREHHLELLFLFGRWLLVQHVLHQIDFVFVRRLHLDLRFQVHESPQGFVGDPGVDLVDGMRLDVIGRAFVHADEVPAGFGNGQGRVEVVHGGLAQLVDVLDGLGRRHFLLGRSLAQMRDAHLSVAASIRIGNVLHRGLLDDAEGFVGGRYISTTRLVCAHVLHVLEESLRRDVHRERLVLVDLHVVGLAGPSSDCEAFVVHPLVRRVGPPLRIGVVIIIEILSRLNALLLNLVVHSDFLDVLPRGGRLHPGDLLTRLHVELLAEVLRRNGCGRPLNPLGAGRGETLVDGVDDIPLIGLGNLLLQLQGQIFLVKALSNIRK